MTWSRPTAARSSWSSCCRATVRAAWWRNRAAPREFLSSRPVRTADEDPVPSRPRARDEGGVLRQLPDRVLRRGRRQRSAALVPVVPPRDAGLGRDPDRAAAAACRAPAAAAESEGLCRCLFLSGERRPLHAAARRRHLFLL